MNKVKFILLVLMLLFIANTANATNIDTLVQKSQLNKTTTIAISVKDTKSGKVIYEYNQNKLMNPASVQKIFTMYSAYNELGPDYTFKTTAYVDKKRNLYIKLGADPTLTKGSLVTLLKMIKEKYNKPIEDIVLDTSIIDNRPWGIGWMWDDDTNPLLPKISPLSINENKIEVLISPSKNGNLTDIKNKSSYNMTLVNKTQKGNTNSIELERSPWLTSDMTYIYGTVNTPTKINLPVASTEKYFIGELNSAIASAGIKHNGTYKFAPIPQNISKIAEISSIPLNEIMAATLKNSNNFYSEMIFKVAGGHYSNATGTTKNAVNMLENQFKNIKSDSHVIVDACGISRNNLISAEWTTEALNSIYKNGNYNQFVTLLPKPIEGTLSNRLLNISLKLRAKTGTASGISSIAGYIDTKSGKKYSFAIFIQNHNTNVVDVKKFEDQIINEIYKM